MNPSDLYDETVDFTVLSVLTGGKEVKTTISFKELLESKLPLLVAFATDNDIQCMKVYSTNFGSIHTYQKRFRKNDPDQESPHA